MLMSNSARVARLRYRAGGFSVLSPGDHVVCAVSGARVPLEVLRYWSVDRQEPYDSAASAARAMGVL
ncbi:DUF2093 domain-containing protein [Sphingomonas sp. CJ20]